MGFFSKAIKGGVAAKVISEARKPQNQQRIKSAVASFRNKRGGGGTAGRSTSRPR